MGKTFFRREPFGAVIVDSSDQVAVLSPIVADLVELGAQGASPDLLESFIRRNYPHLSPDDTRRAFQSSADALRGVLPGSTGSTEDLSEFPTLSYPLDLFWEITRHCNETCAHCYNNSGPRQRGPSDQQLYSVVEELSGTQLRRVSVSGGEPLMRKNFYEFTERVSAVAFEMSLSTNGTLINSDNVGFIASHFDDVQVSLDCSDEQEFDRFRGLHGAFRKTTAGIRALRERDVTVVAQTVLTLSGLRAIEDLGVLLEQLGVSEWNIRLAFASGREVENKAIFPKHKMLLEVSDVFQKLRDRHGGAIRISGGINYENTYNEPYRYTKNASRLVTCSGGTILAALSANGSLAPCPLFSETDYCSDSVWEIGLAEAWRKATCMTEMRSTISDTISGCGTCANLNGKCGGGCRAKSYLAKGTIKSNDYHCNYSR